MSFMALKLCTLAKPARIPNRYLYGTHLRDRGCRVGGVTKAGQIRGVGTCGDEERRDWLKESKRCCIPTFR